MDAALATHCNDLTEPRTARRTGRAMYDIDRHQQAAMPEQLILDDVDQEDRPAAAPYPTVDVQTLRTDLQALELTADQLAWITKAFTALAGDAQQARERGTHQEPGTTAPRTQPPNHQTPTAPPRGPNTAPGPGGDLRRYGWCTPASKCASLAAPPCVRLASPPGCG